MVPTELRSLAASMGRRSSTIPRTSKASSKPSATFLGNAGRTMSGFILFMMFFVSPPALPGKQVWSLHNTEHLDFASMDACKKYGLLMQARFQKVATVKIRGWCVNQKDGTSTYD